MLEQYANQKENVPVAPCRPDPEEMLQSSRRRAEKIEADIALFKQIDAYYVPGGEQYALSLFGAMHRDLDQARDQIEFWLNEINKGE